MLVNGSADFGPPFFYGLLSISWEKGVEDSGYHRQLFWK